MWDMQDTAARTVFHPSRQIRIPFERMEATYSQWFNLGRLHGWSVSLSFTELNNKASVTQSFAAPTPVTAASASS